MVIKPHVVVTGSMGVGKSTVGRAVADSLGWTYVDSDDDIERLLGVTGREFALEEGVPELHRVESAVLLGALAAEGPSVITAAASVVEDGLVRRALTLRAFVVRLHAPIEVVLERQAAGGHRRPMDVRELQRLEDRRKKSFEEVADLTLDASAAVVELVEAINEDYQPRPTC